jgi:Protein of unknown function (DUF2510)
VNAAPRWYIDPQDPARQRYWNGSRWGSDTKPAHADVPEFPDDDEEVELPTAWTLAGRATIAAKSLDTVATSIIAIVSTLAVLFAGTGIVVVILSSTAAHRIAGGALIVGALVVWLFSLVPYMGAQAVARYIQFRVNPKS